MCVCDLLGVVEVGAHQQDTVLPADWPVEGSARSPALAPARTLFRQALQLAREGPPRVLDLVYAPADAGD